MKYFVKTVKFPHLKPGDEGVESLELAPGQRIINVIGAQPPKAGDPDIQLIVLIEDAGFAAGGIISKKSVPCCGNDDVELREGC